MIIGLAGALNGWHLVFYEWFCKKMFLILWDKVLTPRRPICRARQLGMFFVSQGRVSNVIPKRWKNTLLEIQFSFFWESVWLSTYSSLDKIIFQKILGLIIHFMVFTRFLIWDWNFGQWVSTYFRMTPSPFWTNKIIILLNFCLF